MTKPQISDELRQIGWDHWDPIGLSDMRGGWKGRPFEDEYDTYLAKVVEMLSADCSVEEVIEYLFHVESELMGMSPKEINEAIRSKLCKVVTAVRSSL